MRGDDIDYLLQFAGWLLYLRYFIVFFFVLTLEWYIRDFISLCLVVS